MAIKIQGTTVIDDSRNAVSLAAVGIGTTNPSAKLQVGLSETAAELLRLHAAYDTARNDRGGIRWSDSTNITGRIATEYDGTMVSMVFGSLFNSGYNSNNLMIIRGDGTVGVGTITPGAKLHVYNAGATTTYLRVTGQSREAYFGQDGTGCAVYSSGDAPMYFSTNDTEKMRILSGGNVGIGTTNPGYKLDVYQSTNDTTIRTRTGGAGAWFEARDETAYYAGVRHVGAAGARYWLSGMSQGIENYCISMSADGSSNRFLTINTSGNVGIGATSPAGKLTISNAGAEGIEFFTTGAVGNGPYFNAYNRSAGIYVPFTYYANTHTFYTNTGTTRAVDITSAGNVGIGTASPTGKLNVYVDSDTNISIGEHPTYPAYNAIWNPSQDYVLLWDGSNTFLNSRGSGALYFREDNNDLMIISNNGNVGIGTATISYKLHVQGDIFSSAVISATRFRNSGTSYDVPNLLTVRNDDTNWTYGISSNDSSLYWMQVKFYGTSDDNRGFRVLDANGSTVRWRINGAGDMYATGNITAYSSDRRLKTNITAIEKPIEKINMIRGVKFNWDIEECNKWHFHPQENDVGVIAQEIQQVIPEAVCYAPFDRDENKNSISGQEYLTVKYEKIIPLLIEAVKELSAELNIAKAEIATLKSKV